MLRIKDLQALKQILNFTQLSKIADVSVFMILSKLRTGSELRVDESEKLLEALHSFGLEYYPERNDKLK